MKTRILLIIGLAICSMLQAQITVTEVEKPTTTRAAKVEHATATENTKEEKNVAAVSLSQEEQKLLEDDSFSNKETDPKVKAALHWFQKKKGLQ